MSDQEEYTSKELMGGIRTLQESMAFGFAKIDGRLSGVEGRLTSVEGRLTSVEGRLTSVEGRLSGLERRVENGFADMDRRLGRLERPRKRKEGGT